jgi:hypothetical protein
MKQQSLADLASNLSSSNIFNSAEKSLPQNGEDQLAPKVFDRNYLLGGSNVFVI